jgi:hypothetical protein
VLLSTLVIDGFAQAPRISKERIARKDSLIIEVYIVIKFCEIKIDMLWFLPCLEEKMAGLLRNAVSYPQNPARECFFISGGVNDGNHDDRFGVFFHRINNFVGKFVRIPPTNISARLLF